MKKIGIIGGNGVMGSQFAKFFKQAGQSVFICDKKEGYSIDEIASFCDVVILSVPIKSTPAIAKQIAPLLSKEQLFSDFTSVKASVIPLMTESKASVISAHPMFAQANSLQNRPILLLPVKPNNWLSWYQNLYKQLELQTIIIQPWEKHDKFMSIIQGLLHFIHISFAKTLAEFGVEMEDILSMCSPVYKAHFALACRIIQRDPSLYTHILLDNPQNKEILNTFIEQANLNYQYICNQEERQFEEEFLSCRDFLGNVGKKMDAHSDSLIQMFANLNIKE